MVYVSKDWSGSSIGLELVPYRMRFTHRLRTYRPTSRSHLRRREMINLIRFRPIKRYPRIVKHRFFFHRRVSFILSILYSETVIINNGLKTRSSPSSQTVGPLSRSAVSDSVESWQRTMRWLESAGSRESIYLSERLKCYICVFPHFFLVRRIWVPNAWVYVAL